MTDTTITKIDSTHSPKGAAGQKYLACGKSMSMRLWESEKADKDQTDTKREYETVGFVIKGKAELHLEGQMVILNAGDSWVVPIGAGHHYKILEEFSAVEATSPPAELHDRASSDEELSPKEYFQAGAKDAAAVKSAEAVKGATPAMKAKANTETKEDAEAKPKATTEAKPTADDKTDDKDAEKDKDTDGQVCDPNTKECEPGKQDGKEGKAVKEDVPAKNQNSEDKAQQGQEIAAEIPRTASEPTSNSPEKEAKPAEHVEVCAKDKDQPQAQEPAEQSPKEAE
jgi:quercetin dioxygenase-like cupin family protein